MKTISFVGFSLFLVACATVSPPPPGRVDAVTVPVAEPRPSQVVEQAPKKPPAVDPPPLPSDPPWEIGNDRYVREYPACLSWAADWSITPLLERDHQEPILVGTFAIWWRLVTKPTRDDRKALRRELLVGPHLREDACVRLVYFRGRFDPAPDGKPASADRFEVQPPLLEITIDRLREILAVYLPLLDEAATAFAWDDGDRARASVRHAYSLLDASFGKLAPYMLRSRFTALLARDTTLALAERVRLIDAGMKEELVLLDEAERFDRRRHLP
jgi:hypothetical protein